MDAPSFRGAGVSPDATLMLLAAGANPELQDAYGNTVLWRAVMSSNGDGAIILALRNAGASPHAANSSGVSPVGLARTIANFDLARFFSDVVAD